MKWRVGLVVMLLLQVGMYADLQTMTTGNVTVGLYDDTAFGFSLSVQGVGAFLKPNRPPTTLLMMSMDGKTVPVGSAIGFFHQRPVLTNNGIYVSWEARGLKWDVFLRPMKKEPLGDGMLVTITITNVETRATSFGVQCLFDVVAPFGRPIVVGNGGSRVTQESVWQGRTLLTQWAVYSEETNLPGITVVAEQPAWQKVAFAEWKQFYDYPGDTYVRKQNLFGIIGATGVTFFYPVQKLEGGASRTISYWMGASLPPAGIVSLPEKKPAPIPQEEPGVTNPLPVVTNTPVETPPLVTNTNISQVTTPSTNMVQELPREEKPTPEERVLTNQTWTCVLDGFRFASARLTEDHLKRLQQWFSQLEDQQDLVFEVVGHTDPMGSRRVNLALGKKRANAVKAWLLAHGIREKDIVVMSRGESDLVSDDNARNRRVEITARKKR